MLTLTEQSIVFTPEAGDHHLQSSISDLRKFDMKSDKKRTRLSVKAADGKDYNFDVTDPQAIQKLTLIYERISKRSR